MKKKKKKELKRLAKESWLIDKAPRVPSGNLKFEHFPLVLVFSDGKFRGNTKRPIGGRVFVGLYRDGYEKVFKDFEFHQYKRFSDDRSVIHSAIYVDISGINGAEAIIKSPDLPEWIPEDMRYASWRHAWAKRLDDMASLDGLAESLKADGSIKIDRTPSTWWKNHAS